MQAPILSSASTEYHKPKLRGEISKAKTSSAPCAITTLEQRTSKPPGQKGSKF